MTIDVKESVAFNCTHKVGLASRFFKINFKNIDNLKEEAEECGEIRETPISHISIEEKTIY